MRKKDILMMGSLGRLVVYLIQVFVRIYVLLITLQTN